MSLEEEANEEDSMGELKTKMMKRRSMRKEKDLIRISKKILRETILRGLK